MSEDRKRRLLERITEDDFLDDLEQRPLEELRAMRDECREGENEISFERRLCQARIDILTAELDRRTGKETGDLVSRLPEILAAESEGGSDSPLPNRAPTFAIPRNADVPRRRVEEIVGEQTLARLSQLQPQELQSIISSLGEHERKLSERRRRIHEIVDEVQAEIVRRYTTGQADPSAALR
jgi:hypothetical protein